MDTPQKNKLKALGVTLGMYAILFMVLFLVSWKTDPRQEEGVLISLGEGMEGGMDENPAAEGEPGQQQEQDMQQPEDVSDDKNTETDDNSESDIEAKKSEETKNKNKTEDKKTDVKEKKDVPMEDKKVPERTSDKKSEYGGKKDNTGVKNGEKDGDPNSSGYKGGTKGNPGDKSGSKDGDPNGTGGGLKGSGYDITGLDDWKVKNPPDFSEPLNIDQNKKTIRLKITVDESGHIVKVSQIIKGSNTTDPYYVDYAKRCAMKSTYIRSSSYNKNPDGLYEGILTINLIPR